MPNAQTVHGDTATFHHTINLSVHTSSARYTQDLNTEPCTSEPGGTLSQGETPGQHAPVSPQTHEQGELTHNIKNGSGCTLVLAATHKQLL